MKDSIRLSVGPNIQKVLCTCRGLFAPNTLNLRYENYNLVGIDYSYLDINLKGNIDIYERDIEKLIALSPLIKDDLEFFLIINDHAYTLLNTDKVKANDYSRYYEL